MFTLLLIGILSHKLDDLTGIDDEPSLFQPGGIPIYRWLWAIIGEMVNPGNSLLISAIPVSCLIHLGLGIAMATISIQISRMAFRIRRHFLQVHGTSVAAV
jgi:hypothetical protein